MSKSSLHAAYRSLLNSRRVVQNPGQVALVDRLAVLQQTLLENPGPQNGLYIYGDVGTGKSLLADLFSSTLPSTITKRRVHFYEFMMDIHTRLHRARSKPGYLGDPLVKIGREVRKESRVLCFDEFQVTDIADAMILRRLLGSIWDSGGVMVSTSNRHPTRLYEKGLNRALFLPFIAELQLRCEVWKMEGTTDYRTVDIEPKARVPIFLTDPQEFEQAITRTAGGTPFRLVSIPVMMNRSLQIEAFGPTPPSSPSPVSPTTPTKSVVQTTFTSLCERPLGSSDYHALCAASSTIFLSGLRRFKADELDFIRRFITLIDLAYESKTRVVCLSSVPINEVFAAVMGTSSASSPSSSSTTHPGVSISVRREGGSSSSMMSTFIGGTEWSATGLARASLASGGAGETDVAFAVARAVSRLSEMGWKSFGK